MLPLHTSLRVMTLLAALTPRRAGAQPPAGPDDALGTAGFFTDLAGDTAVRERARQEAAAQARKPCACGISRPAPGW